jgi:hypothetical protein
MINKYYWFFLLFLSSNLLGSDYKEKSENLVLLDELSSKISEFSRSKKYTRNTKLMITINNMYSFNDSFIKVNREILCKALQEVLSGLVLIETHLALKKLEKIKDKIGQEEEFDPYNLGPYLPNAQEAGTVAQNLTANAVKKFVDKKLRSSLFLSYEGKASETLFCSYFPEESKNRIKSLITSYLYDYLREQNYFINDLGNFIYSLNGRLFMRENQLVKNCHIELLALACEPKLENMIMAELVKRNNLFKIKKSVFCKYTSEKVNELKVQTPKIKDLRQWRLYQERFFSSNCKISLQPWLSSLDEFFRLPYIIFLLGQNDEEHELNIIPKDVIKYIIILALNS